MFTCKSSHAYRKRSPKWNYYLYRLGILCQTFCLEFCQVLQKMFVRLFNIAHLKSNRFSLACQDYIENT